MSVVSKTCSQVLNASDATLRINNSTVSATEDKCVDNFGSNCLQNSVENNCFVSKCNGIKETDDQTIGNCSSVTNNFTNREKVTQINGQNMCPINEKHRSDKHSKTKTNHMPSKSSIHSSNDINGDKTLDTVTNVNNCKVNGNDVKCEQNSHLSNDKNNNLTKARLDLADRSSEDCQRCDKATNSHLNCSENNLSDGLTNHKKTCCDASDTASVVSSDCKSLESKSESNSSQLSESMPKLIKQTSNHKPVSNSMCSKCRKKSVSNVRIQCKMDQYLSSRLQSLPPSISLSLLTPRVPLPAPDLLNLKYGKYYRVEHYPNGMAKVLHLYWDEIIQLTVEEKNELALEFLKESFREETPNVAKYVISIVHNAASNLPDLLEYFADAEPHLTVKAGVLGHSGSDIETTTMQAYRNNVSAHHLMID